MFRTLDIRSPKRCSRVQTGWEGYFPYYAGYSETFAKAILDSAKLGPEAIVFDPWNGSGTTTYTASTLGFRSRGFDINPVMVVVARARLLPASEADSIEPVAREVVRIDHIDDTQIEGSDPLQIWFNDETAAGIRAIERSIRKRLLGNMTTTSTGTNFDKISGLAATFYVALFTVCRELVAPFRCSNPTWLRRPKETEARINVSQRQIADRMLSKLASMAQALEARAERSFVECGASEIRVADTTSAAVDPESADFILTSPPYCTRIDYTAATRIELAVMAPQTSASPEDLSRRMIGS
ncbi:MAG: site-specific DNA-methyltransferase, partial [Rhodospirillales bacterium]|nr:site-specific DNA-methyltransferase [Rhodospirillales bacterium]